MRKKRRVDQLAAGASTDANADCDAKAGAGAAPLAEPSSVSYTDCSIHSESYKEMIQQNLKWAEMRKERLQLIESYKEGAPAIHFLPMFTSTGKLSQDNATMMELMPRFVEMRRRRERGEPDWSFNQEGYDRYVKQGGLFLSHSLNIFAHVLFPVLYAWVDCFFASISGLFFSWCHRI